MALYQEVVELEAAFGAGHDYMKVEERGLLRKWKRVLVIPGSTRDWRIWQEDIAPRLRERGIMVEIQ